MPYYDIVASKESSLFILSRGRKFSSYATYRKDVRMKLVLISLRYLRYYISRGGKKKGLWWKGEKCPLAKQITYASLVMNNELNRLHFFATYQVFSIFIYIFHSFTK